MAEAAADAWRITSGRDEFVRGLAATLADDFRAAVAARGHFLFGASGGSTPEPVYRRLATMPLPWSSLSVLVVDERAVPPQHEASNQRMIAASLLATHPEAKLIGLWSDAGSLDAMAAVADERVRSLAAPLDTVLLGMGEDGHFASCFPSARRFEVVIDPDADAHVLAIAPMPTGVHPAIERLSLSWAFLRRARRIVLAVTGERKREVLRQAMHDEDPARLPVAALFRPGMPGVDIHWSA